MRTLLLVPLRGDLNLVSDMLIFLLITVVVAMVGGLLPALVAAVLGSALLNYFFTPPLHTLTIRDTNNALALFVFIVVGMLVSSVVDLAARRTREAARSAAEARTLANLATSVFAEGDALGQMLERLREAFALDSVTLMQQEGDRWRVLAATGAPCGHPDEAESSVPAGQGRVLAMRGRLLEADDRRLVGAFGTQVAVLLDRIRLRETSAAASELEAANRMRTALLAAVGHDLRTPLAAAKASVSSLLSSDVHLDRQDRRDLLAAADESLDRLAGLVDNLLDMSRLQAGALSMHLQPTAVDEVVARALDDLGPDSGRVRVEVPDVLPVVSADPGLLERVVANLLANALRFSPADQCPLVTASRLADTVEVRVVDRGPGIPEGQRDEVFVPFQRLGDTDNTTGVGLGLALSRGLTEAMGGSLDAEDTPGGGLTMVVRLRVAAGEQEPEPGLRERAQEAQETARETAQETAQRRPGGRSRDPRRGRRRRAPDPARPLDQPAGPWVRRADGRLRRGGAGRGGGPPARGGRARPRAAGHGRRRGDRRTARLDDGADPGALGPHGLLRQGRGPRRGRRRLRDQTVRDGRAARPAAGGGAARRPGWGGAGRRRAGGRHRRPGGPPRRPRRRRRPPHADGVAPARGAACGTPVG